MYYIHFLHASSQVDKTTWKWSQQAKKLPRKIGGGGGQRMRLSKGVLALPVSLQSRGSNNQSSAKEAWGDRKLELLIYPPEEEVSRTMRSSMRKKQAWG
jgi:hypothetical protein